MTVSSYSSEAKTRRKSQDNDWRLFLKLIPYTRGNRGILLFSMILLVPLAIAGAIQPLIIGQAVSILRQEPTWSFLANLSVAEGINTLVGILLATVIIRLMFASLQGYLVQKIGQEITAAVREDLFVHVTNLASSFFDRTPVGKLVTRITNDVEALGDVFASGAIGVVSDFVSIIAIVVTMYIMDWRLASMLVLMLIPVTALIIYFQQQYRTSQLSCQRRTF